MPTTFGAALRKVKKRAPVDDSGEGAPRALRLKGWRLLPPVPRRGFNLNALNSTLARSADGGGKIAFSEEDRKSATKRKRG